MKITEVRRQNLRKLIEHYGGSSALSVRLGYRSPSFLVQQAGPNPTREVTERSARRFEEKLGLPPGSLDEGFGPPGVPPAPAGRSPTPTPPTSARRRASDTADAGSTAMIADVIRLVGNVMQAEQVQTPGPERFADLVVLALTDAMEHGGVPREHHIRNVVRLLRA